MVDKRSHIIGGIDPDQVEAERKKGLVTLNGGKKITVKEVAGKLHRHKGSMAAVAKDLKVEYGRIARLVDVTYSLQDIILGYREALVDRAEDVLFDSLERGNLKAAMFTLKTLGRRRGYVERREEELTIIDKSDSSKAIDVSKLTTEQLTELAKILIKEPPMLNVTPDKVEGE